MQKESKNQSELKQRTGKFSKSSEVGINVSTNISSYKKSLVFLCQDIQSLNSQPGSHRMKLLPPMELPGGHMFFLEYYISKGWLPRL